MSNGRLGVALHACLDALRQRTGRPLRFLIAGAINTAFGLGIYPVLMWTVPYLSTRYLATLGAAQAISLFFAFAIYKLALSRTSSNLVREFGTFSTFYLLNYAVNWALLPLLVEVAKIPAIVAQPFFVAALLIGSYFWHSRLTFKAPESRP